MFLKCVLIICVHKLVLAQISGEFWWLSDKLKRVNKIESPKFEQLTEFDTDENDKILFGNDAPSKNNIVEEIKFNNNKNRKGKENNNTKLGYEDRTGKVWHTHESLIRNKIEDMNSIAKDTFTDTTTQKHEDEFNFYFPDDKKVAQSVNVTSTTVSNPSNIKLNSINRSNSTTSKPNYNVHENICSYMDKEECKHYNGLMYEPNHKRSTKLEINSYFTFPLVCCILPLNTNDKKTQKVIVPANSRHRIRVVRSTSTGQNAVLNQRQALIRRLSLQTQNLRVTSRPYLTEKIITPDEDDDYTDPYANVKNNAFKPPQNTKYAYTKPSYAVQDYDYGPTDEVPRPGLVGLYSDGHWSGSWTFENDDVVTDEEEDSEVGYGISTVDPRLDKRIGAGSGKIPQRRVPIKVVASEESSYETESHTISYQSNPNFNVLQGFKLLNLVTGKTRTPKKNSRKSTTESFHGDDPDSVIVDSAADSSGSVDDDLIVPDKQVFKECGRTWNYFQTFDERQGDASYGSNPWLSLVVRSRQQRRTMCHATLIHPRAAVTAATCAYGAVPGEVILYAGLWDISEENTKLSQQRMASVHLHPHYTGDTGHDLAILHWNRPLRLGANVQPACLADPHVGDCCGLVGWGGQGQVINMRPHWQRASIITPRECTRLVKRSGTRLLKDAFCASAQTQGCVNGIGGALICGSNGKQAVVGVVVSRDGCDESSPIILLPAHDWIRRALSGLGIV